MKTSNPVRSPAGADGTVTSGVVESRYLPAPLPPALEASACAEFVSATADILGQYSARFAAESREQVCRRFLALPNADGGATDSVREAREPWRSRDTDFELYLKAPNLSGAVADLLAPDALTELHRQLVGGGDFAAELFAQAGRLRSTSGVLSRADGSIHVVHPPPEWIARLLADVAAYLRRAKTDGTPPVLAAALHHFQLLAIHPFVDGNGRLTSLLTERWLHETRTVTVALPLSIIFHRNYRGYLARLAGVTFHDEWTKWIRFFCAAIAREVSLVLEAADVAAALSAEVAAVSSAPCSFSASNPITS